ncbi:unnamed protein product [Medioppia subpectinata]|uniref:Uncharacterized protein n=1 Tax=Medioppia subpectinata TaxID=1979941 RepID=A0A7R9KRX1_9ACAR|nr:unnamed protein product [Medioppia subpectinata]CAG2107489.1 unnamed protein product [Medioppia subpectinata]
MQLYEVCFGIGSILSTVALKPYLIGETDNEVKNQTIYADNELVINVEDVIDRRSRLMIPTLIIGGCIITVPLALFVMHFIKPYEEPKEKCDENSSEDMNKSATLLIPGRTSVTTLWAASIATCFGFSGMFAGIYAFTEEHLNMTTRLSATFLLFRGVFTLITPFIVGNWIEDYSLVFIYMEFLFLAISIVLFAIINVMIKN